MASLLSPWSNFYVIVGSAGAALTGLQFVVVALAADKRVITQASARTFATPTIVHFSMVFVVSAILSAPWRSAAGMAATLGGTGAVGLIYCLLIARQARHHKDYRPVLEDWIWHVAIPILSYSILVAESLQIV